MKYGIITQPLLNNFGGTLQNFALQQAIKKLGGDAITLDYLPYKSIGQVILSLAYNIVLSFKGQQRSLIECLPARRDKYVHSFLESHVNCSAPIRKYSQELIDNYRLDGIIVGSDQVWRPKYNQDVIEDMFLGFTEQSNIKRIAYAASFGVSSWEYDSKLQKRCSALINKFDAVSVRELDGVSLCKEYFKVNASLVPDPTILLDQDDYLCLFDNNANEAKDYLYTYILNESEEKNSYIVKVSEALHKETKNVSVKSNLDCSIEQWVANIANASYVITDSFHGTVFSIIFHKPFVVIENTSRGSSRMVSLLESTGLEDRMVKEKDLVEGFIPSQFINWSDVEQKLGSLRKTGEEFLRNNL